MKNNVPFRRGKYLAALIGLWLWPLAPVFALGFAPLRAAPITLAWDSANDPSVQGYRIYYGQTNQPAINYANAGTNLTVTLFNLQANTGYWIYAVSYDAAGNESVPSNQLLLTPSVLSRLRITRLATGEFRLTLRAAPGAVCRVEYLDLTNHGNWLTLSVATANTNGDLAVMDATLPQRPSRLYRAAWVFNPLSATGAGLP